MTQDVAFSINEHIRNKPPEWRSEFASGWASTESPLQALRDQVTAGRAFVPAAMSSHHRTSAAFLHADIAVVDVDYGLTLEQFKEHPLSRQAAWVYTTASHNPDVDADRFRVVFNLPRRISNPSLYKAAVTLLSRSLGGDKSCTDPCRLFYGNDKAQHPLWNPGATLDDGFMQDVNNEAARQRQTFDHTLAEVDEETIQRAAFVLEQVISPTQDGERDRFIRITAAARSAGDHLYEPWVRWASTSHHGSGKNSRQATERFFRQMRGSSLATLFFLASEEDPNWRDLLPSELKAGEQTPRGVFGPSFAGYGHEDFLYDPDADNIPTDGSTQNLFDPARPWSAVAPVTRSPQTTQSPTPWADDSFYDDDEPFDLSAVKQTAPPAYVLDPGIDDSTPPPGRRGAGRPKNGSTSASGGQAVNDAHQVMDLLKQAYPGLRLNLATQALEYGSNDKPEIIHDSSVVYITLSGATTKTFAKTLVHDALYVAAQQNGYNPIKSYLERCASTSQPSPHIKTIASDFLGIPDDDRIMCPIMPDGRKVADVVMERFMIAAVARAMEPGCICDWMPILVGSQGSGKTTFLQHLTPPDQANSLRFPFFNTVQQGVTYIKDRPHVLHCGWIVCFDEMERLFKRQYTEELKNLISVPVDRSAPKYQNERNFPRSFVLCGATNSYSFLQDPTGNRRFMPVMVSGKIPSPRDTRLKRIDLEGFKAEREALWSAAFAAYQRGEQHLFDSYELSTIDDYMDAFFEDNPLESQIDRLLEDRFSGTYQNQYYVTLFDLFKWMDVPITMQAAMTRQVTDVLKRRGWTLRRVSIRKKISRIWVRPDGKLPAAG